MLMKEFKTIGKQGLILLGIMLLLPGFVFVERIFVPTAPSYFDAFFVFLQIGALSWAFFMGISMFSNEKRQGGIEYLLTLPYSRYQLLALKAIPRILSIILMFLFYLAVYHLGGIEVSLMGKLSFMAWYFTIFVLSLSLSTTSENFLKLSVNLFVAFGLVVGALYFLVMSALRIRSGGDFGITAMDLFMVGADKFEYLSFTVYSLSLLVLPFLIAFIIHFKRFDASYSRENRMGYLKVLVPALVVGVLLSFFTTYRSLKPAYQMYYLTQQMQLLEVDSFEGTVYDANGSKLIKGFHRFSFPILEDERYIYDFSFVYNAGKRYGKLMRLDKNDLSVSSIYDSSPSRLAGHRGWGWKNDIVFLEWGKNDQLTIVRVDRDNQRVRKIDVPGIQKQGRKVPVLIGADESNGNEFFLMNQLSNPGRDVIRVWADGRIESLGIKSVSPLYVNGMLLTPTRDGGMLRFWSLDDQGAEMLKEIRVNLRFYSYYWNSMLKLNGLDEICGIMDRKLYRVDLENLSVEVVSESAAYPRQAMANGGIYYAEMSSNYMVKSLNRYYKGKREVLKELNLDTIKTGNYLRIFNHGIVLERDGKISVYSLPDLKEFKYKDLK
jgi:ABC-type transport system involved in multi-copper enzyme maturation permease subunit